jgi:outer membrane receptor protein involved in Fe transport
MTSTTSSWPQFLIAGIAIGVLSAAAPPAGAAAPGLRSYDLPSEDLAQALRTVGLLAQREVVAPTQLLAGRRSPALKGDFTPEGAFAALLDGSGLEMTMVGDTVVVRDPNGPGRSIAAPGVDPVPEIAADVVVTGTRIRGAPPTSPVITVTRKDIDDSGYADIGDVMRALPESFQGGQNPGVQVGASAAGIGNQNISNGSTINLRGLGSDATLVLLNGHRLAGDSFFQAPDISGIPLSAIARVEVVTDGASALYGSDAVAGVANILLRKDYQGAEVSARVGGATDGGGLEQTYSALGGADWGGGHLLLNAEYSHQEALRADQKAFTAGVTPETPLIEPQVRKSFLISGEQALTPIVSFALDALYSERSAQGYTQYALGGAAYHEGLYTPNFSVTGAFNVTLPYGWHAAFTGSAAGDRNNENTLATTATTRSTSHIRYENNTQYGEASADGVLLRLPSGDWRLALGGGYRNEDFDLANYTGHTDETGARNVGYVFGESLIPLANPSWGLPALQRLDLSLAGRFERYSDVGASATPKVGLSWIPVDGLNIRGSWGKSFKAPSFLQETQNHVAYLFNATDLGSTKPGTALLDYGGNPDLKPERSTSWTAGFEYRPPMLRTLVVSGTYFNIDYTDRIVQPITSTTFGLSNPSYAPFVNFDPTAAQLAQTIASTTKLYNYTTGAYDPTKVIAILQDQYLNATAQTVDGFDLSARETFLMPLGVLDTSLNATWERLTQKTSAVAPTVVLTGTIFNPPTVRVRAGATWRYQGFSATSTLNYVSGETDTSVKPNAHIASFTTVDLNLAYVAPKTLSVLQGFEFVLSATNLLDKDPPYARGAGVSYAGLDYDSTNASAIGRFVAFTVRKRW